MASSFIALEVPFAVYLPSHIDWLSPCAAHGCKLCRGSLCGGARGLCLLRMRGR